MERRKRIALSVPPEMDIILERLSILIEQPKTKIILELLEESIPALEQTLIALEQMKENKDNAVNIARDFGHDLLKNGNQKLGIIASEINELK